MEKRTLGQIAYEAYGDKMGWKAPRRFFVVPTIPRWQHLSDDVKAAWESAGKSVNRETLSRAKFEI